MTGRVRSARDDDGRIAVGRRTFLRVGGGAVAVAAAPTAAAQEATPARQPRSHTVDMNDQLLFVPEEITIAPGDTVVWDNVGNIGHTVTAYEDDLPEGAAYFASGGFDGEAAARSGYPQRGDIPGGETYEHTFETEGEYPYFCIPHESAGMVGTVVVREGGAPAGGGEDGAGEAGTVPGGELGLVTLLAALGAAGLAGLALLGLEAYTAAVRVPTGDAAPPPAEEDEDDPALREIGHREFDPTGTAALVAAYFVILVVMWLVMYFVEFLGNGPTIMG